MGDVRAQRDGVETWRPGQYGLREVLGKSRLGVEVTPRVSSDQEEQV